MAGVLKKEKREGLGKSEPRETRHNLRCLRPSLLWALGPELP
jgi:hypothetical protein